MYATKFEGWFLLIEFEPVYNSSHGNHKYVTDRLYFIKDLGSFMNDSVDLNCFMPRNIIRLMNFNTEKTKNSFDYLNQYKEITKKRFNVNETDSIFNLHEYSTILYTYNLLNNCCDSLKKVESRKLHFFYGKMEGEFIDEYRELFCDDYLRYIPRYVFFPLEECNSLIYKFSIVLPPPKRILRLSEDFKFYE